MKKLVKVTILMEVEDTGDDHIFQEAIGDALDVAEIEWDYIGSDDLDENGDVIIKG